MNRTLAAPLAASFTTALADFKDALTRSLFGLTEIAARLRYEAGAEVSTTVFDPTLAATVVHDLLSDTDLPLSVK
ncbi:MAG: hypothetical protein ABSD97_05270 [Acidimicrobiales bacterium]